MKFEIGKCYKHSGGGRMKIVGEANTTVWGNCLVGEETEGRLTPVGRLEENAVNWEEISEAEWIKNVS